MLSDRVFPITIVEMRSYTNDAEKVFSEPQHDDLKNYLALHPEAGDLLPNTGGVRKLEWPLNGMGDVPAVDVFYYFRDLNMPLFLLGVGPREDGFELTGTGCLAMQTLVNGILIEYELQYTRHVQAVLGSSAVDKSA